MANHTAKVLVYAGVDCASCLRLLLGFDVSFEHMSIGEYWTPVFMDGHVFGISSKSSPGGKLLRGIDKIFTVITGMSTTQGAPTGESRNTDS